MNEETKQQQEIKTTPIDAIQATQKMLFNIGNILTQLEHAFVQAEKIINSQDDKIKELMEGNIVSMASDTKNL